MAAAAVLAGAASAWAQAIGSQARERYERRQKGTNIDDFVKKLGSAEPDERLQAVKSLAESNDEKAVDYLIEAVGDGDVRVTAKAITVLGQMRAVEATPVLIQYLFLRTTDPQMKTLILASLGQIGDVRAARPIADFLQRDLDPPTRGTAIFALGEIGAEDAEQPLAAIAGSERDPTLRRLAGEALAKVRRRRATESAEAKEPAASFLDRDQPAAQ